MKGKNIFKLLTPQNLSEFSSFLVLAAVLLLSVYAVSLLRQPPPYEYKNLRFKPNIVACPGDKFTYDVDIYSNRVPVSILRTETFYSDNGNDIRTFDYDKWSDVEVFNWDTLVKGKLHRHNVVTVPKVFRTGFTPSAGNYRYIANLNSFGERFPASISIPFTIPKNCHS